MRNAPCGLLQFARTVLYVSLGGFHARAEESMRISSHAHAFLTSNIFKHGVLERATRLASGVIYSCDPGPSIFDGFRPVSFPSRQLIF